MIIEAVMIGKGYLFVYGLQGQSLRIKIDSHPVLNKHSAADISVFEVDPDGSFVHWPKLDIHLGWDQFMQFCDPEVLQKAKEKASEFNKRYGAVIRKLRKENKLAQSKIKGLPEKQLRKIEKGEVRINSKAVKALASAHGLDPNAYLDKLAKSL